MPNKVLRCTTECRLTNAAGLEEHYEDERTEHLYEVTEDRAVQLMRTGNFVNAPPGAVAHVSFAGPDDEEEPEYA